jgi:hypothetical protein
MQRIRGNEEVDKEDKKSWTWWFPLVIPATCRSEARGFKFKASWTIIMSQNKI